MQKSRVGSKGELFPPKKIREKLGLQAHTQIIYTIEDNKLIVEPIPSLQEVFKEPSAIEITLQDFHKHRKEVSQKAES